MASGPEDGVVARVRRRADLEAAARRAIALRDLAGAVPLLEELLRLAPGELFALDTLGFCHFALGRPAEAERFCREALARAPAHAYALKGLGLCLAAQGREAEGIAALERAAAVAPRDFDVRHDLGVTLLACGQKARALEAFRAALALDPRQGAALARPIADLEAELGASG